MDVARICAANTEYVSGREARSHLGDLVPWSSEEQPTSMIRRVNKSNMSQTYHGVAGETSRVTAQGFETR